MRRGCLIVGVVMLAMITVGCWALDPGMAVVQAGFHLGREFAVVLSQLLETLTEILKQLQG